MKIVFTGGGTAGHVTPNIALIDKMQDCDAYYIGTNGMEKDITAPLVADGRITEYCTITAHKLRRKLSLENLLLPFRLYKSVGEAKKHLKRIAPDVIFSKGGYVGLPVTIAGKQLGIPTVIHESDMSPGLANRLCARFADVYLSAFDCDKRARVVGALVRDVTHGDRQKGLAAMGIDGTKPVLLVTGGSLGAQSLNEAICRHPELAERFDIFVITGKNKRIECDHVRQAEFSDQMPDLFAAADVCLTRAGANSLAELTLAQLPFVTAPLTKQSRGEQVQNAEWFVSRGCGLLLHEDRLESELCKAINAAYDNRTAIQAKQRARRGIYGTDKIAEILRETRRDKMRLHARDTTNI